MSTFRIYRMKESARQQFRWAPHTIGVTRVKPKDYEPASAIEALTPYGVWMFLKDSPEPLQVGDVLESDSGELRVYKYVGFEEAQWVLPETKTGTETAPVVPGQPVSNAGAM
jgi:hypothetical protein